MNNDDEINAITVEMLDNKYLKKRHKITHKTIHSENSVGIINGLWSKHVGGIIPIECNFYPSNNFLDFKLTGYKEMLWRSMNVAKTLAWKLQTKNYGE